METQSPKYAVTKEDGSAFEICLPVCRCWYAMKWKYAYKKRNHNMHKYSVFFFLLSARFQFEWVWVWDRFPCYFLLQEMNAYWWSFFLSAFIWIKTTLVFLSTFARILNHNQIKSCTNRDDIFCFFFCRKKCILKS